MERAWKPTRLAAMPERKDDQERARLIQAVKHNPRPGLPRLLRHDMRRTAVRNFVSAGTSERVALQITGHKFRSTFDRHCIGSLADLRSRPGVRGRVFGHASHFCACPPSRKCARIRLSTR